MNRSDLSLILLTFGSLGIAIFVYIATCLLLYLRQTRLIFFPNREQLSEPDYFELSYENLSITLAATGDKLHGWWMPHPHEKVAPVLVYFHGNKGNIGCCLQHVPDFHQLGFSVVMVDYRGYGLSSGPFPNEQHVYEDAETILDYLINTRKIPEHQILVYGHSLGGAIAIHALTHSKFRPAGLVVEGSFTSLQALGYYRRRYRLLPLRWLLKQHFESINKVGLLQVPVLFMHGTKDRIVPPFMSQQLFEAAPEPKYLELFPGAGHVNVTLVVGDRYLQVLRDFSESLGIFSFETTRSAK